MLENQNLTYENKQLNVLLKEYEQTLEGVMGKFRGVCVSCISKVLMEGAEHRVVQHAATQHELTVHRYYTSLIQQLQTTHSTSSLHDSTTLSTLLQRLSTLIRAALRATNGEDENFEHPGFEMPFAASEKPPSLSAVISDIQNIATTTNGSAPRSSGASSNDTKWLGDQGVSGGYSGKSMARLDWSIEREGEILRLEEENRILREILGVSKDMDLDTLAQTSDDKQETQGSGIQLANQPERQQETTEQQNQGVDIKEIPEGYTVEEKSETNTHSEERAIEIEKPPGKKVQHDLDDSALAEEEDEPPTSPRMTATASLVRSLSTSPKAQFKSPKMSKYATYSGGTPRSPAISRSQSAAPNGSQPPLGNNVSSPNASLSSIFPRQAKTEPTTATTTTVDLEDGDVSHAIQKPSLASSTLPQSSIADTGANGIGKNKMEIQKVSTPPLPGSPLGKTPPKTGISRDHAVESRLGASGKDDSSSSKLHADKPDEPREDSNGKRVETRPEQKSNDKQDKVSIEAPVKEEEEGKPTYAEVAKEDGGDE